MTLGETDSSTSGISVDKHFLHVLGEELADPTASRTKIHYSTQLPFPSEMYPVHSVLATHPLSLTKICPSSHF